MPNSDVPLSNPGVSSAKLERKLRLSLPDKAPSTSATGDNRRNTIAEDSLPRVRKKSKAPITPTILEDENEVLESRVPAVVIVNETKSKELNRSSSATSKRSALGSRAAGSKSTFTYDNGAFEGNLRATNEVRPASRTPSLRSLEVYREQYCCCARRTKCERYLLVTVTILAIIVIVLIIVIAVLAKNGNFDTLTQLNMNL